MKNNRLQGLSELEDDRDAMMDVWNSNEKPAARKSDASSMLKDVPTEKVERMRERCKKSINCDKDYDELDKDEQAEQKKNMNAMKFYSKNLREKTCDDVTGMLTAGDDG